MVCWLLLLGVAEASAVTHDIDAYGARRGDPAAATTNAAALSAALAAAAPGDSVLVRAGGPYFVVASRAAYLHNVTVRLEGELRLHTNFSAWPYFHHLAWLTIEYSSHLALRGGLLCARSLLRWRPWPE